MQGKSRKNEIKNDFKDHKATLTKHGNLEVLDWKKPGTRFYYIRYVFDDFNMYVSGDMGEAVFRFTQSVGVHSFEFAGLNYFESKLKAYHEDKKDFNNDIAVKEIRLWLRQLEDTDIEYDKEEAECFIQEVEGCVSKSHWESIINNSSFICDTDLGYWEWAFDIGNETPVRIASYLIGLQMASKQLKEQNITI